MQQKIKALRNQLNKHGLALIVRKNPGPYFPDYYAQVVNQQNWAVMFGSDSSSFEEVEDWVTEHRFA